MNTKDKVLEELLEEASKFFNAVGIDFIEIKIPINSDVYCVRRRNRQWGAYRLGDEMPVVEFGKYNYMWGFDSGYCLVSVKDEDTTTFANRGIVNEQGVEIVKPYTFNNIWNFYGRDEPYIVVFVGNKIQKLNKKFLKLL